MHEAKYGVNSITVGAAELLLAAAGGGSAVHLARLAEAGVVGQSAVPADRFPAEMAQGLTELANYDPAVLLAPRWSQTTLCGLAWVEMVGGDGGSISPWD